MYPIVFHLYESSVSQWFNLNSIKILTINSKSHKCAQVLKSVFMVIEKANEEIGLVLTGEQLHPWTFTIPEELPKLCQILEIGS